MARLARFNYKVHYKPGRLHSNLDVLSRFLMEQPQGDVNQCQEDMEATPILASTELCRNVLVVKSSQ